MTRRTVNAVRLSVAIYRWLLALYPRSHRQEYGESMVQVFRDQCREGIGQGGVMGLIGLWGRTVIDLLRSAAVEQIDAARRMLMAVDRGIKPLPWWEIGLAVVPGVLLVAARTDYRLDLAATIGVGLMVIAALVVLIVKKELPAWGLFALGLLVFGGLMTVGFRVTSMMERQANIDLQMGRTLLMIPVWGMIGWLWWQYARKQRIPKPAVILAGVMVAILFVSMGHFYYYTILRKEGLLSLIGWTAVGLIRMVGMMLLPVMLGLPLARQHRAHALLLVIGAYSVWTFDSDFYFGYILREIPFYPAYVAVLLLMFMAVGPLLLLRARSWRGQVIGVLVPVSAALIVRVVVPLLINANRHGVLIWLGDSMASVAVLVGIGLALVLYRQVDDIELSLVDWEGSDLSVTEHPL